jgi:hypothetical protein
MLRSHIWCPLPFVSYEKTPAVPVAIILPCVAFSGKCRILGISSTIGMFRGIVLNIIAILVAVQSQQRAPSLHVPILWIAMSVSSQFRYLFVLDTRINCFKSYICRYDVVGDFIPLGSLAFRYGDFVYVSPY